MRSAAALARVEEPVISEQSSVVIDPKAVKAATLDARSWAEAYRKQAGLTKAAMGDKIGYSRSAYARWEEGTYEGDPEPIAAAVRTLRDKEEGPGGISVVIGFRETRTSAIVFRALDLARRGEMMILIGESGVGKTQALRESRARALRAREAVPVYIEGTVFTSGYALVQTLAREIGLDTRANPDTLIRAIADKLTRSPRVIILDEAHYAHTKAIEALRQIRDMSGVGLVLAGTSTFAGIPFGQLANSDLLAQLLEHRPELEQVVSRATIWELPGVTHDEIESIAKSVLGPCTPDGLERLLARAGESIRRMVRLVDEVRQVRARRKLTGPVDAAQIDQAWSRLYLRREKKLR
jgi:DNA transposition AAA+ family ATPase